MADNGGDTPLAKKIETMAMKERATVRLFRSNNGAENAKIGSIDAKAL